MSAIGRFAKIYKTSVKDLFAEASRPFELSAKCPLTDIEKQEKYKQYQQLKAKTKDPQLR